MTFVAKSSDIITEPCTLSDSVADSTSVKARFDALKSRSPTATNAVFHSVHQCSRAPEARSLHDLALKRLASRAKAASDAGSAHDEAASTDFSDAESCARSASCDADTLTADGSGSDSERASLLGASTRGAGSDAEAAYEEAAGCVYSVMLLLQLRAGSLRRCGAGAARCCTRSAGALEGGAPTAGGRPRRWPLSDDDKVARAARSILNKLTVEKFDALHEKLATCGVRTPAQVALLMREIFEKATEQHHFIAMYADLCVRLEADARLSCAVGAEGEPNSFRRLLLGQCQSAFEKLFDPDEQPAAPAQDAELEQERRALRKRRALGNVKLVGHLLVRGMLTSKLLVECSDALLASRATCPEALESLAALLTVAAHKFDQKGWRGKERLDAIFDAVAALTADKAVPTRVRFLLRDVLDLRRAGWQQHPRATAEPKGPMRLEEVKRQAERSAQDCVGGGGRRQAALWRCPAKQLAYPDVERPNSPAVAAAAAAAPRHGPPCRQAGGAPPPPRGAGLPPTAAAAEAPLPQQPSAPRAAAPAASPATPGAAGPAFSAKDFHRELSATLRDLGADLNVVAAVRRVRGQGVPPAHHCGEFVDIITRAAEEKRGPARRSMFAFAAGLMNGEDSAFERARCLEGVRTFFREVYEELCLEVPRLQQIVSAELLPALKSVASARDLSAVLPEELRLAL